MCQALGNQRHKEGSLPLMQDEWNPGNQCRSQRLPCPQDRGFTWGGGGEKGFLGRELGQLGFERKISMIGLPAQITAGFM